MHRESGRLRRLSPRGQTFESAFKLHFSNVVFSGVCFSFGSWAREQRLVEAAPPRVSGRHFSASRRRAHRPQSLRFHLRSAAAPSAPHSLFLLFPVRRTVPLLCSHLGSSHSLIPHIQFTLSPPNSASSVALPAPTALPLRCRAFSSSHPPLAASRPMTRLLPPARGPFPLSPLRGGFSVTATSEFRLCSSPLGPWPSLPGTCAWVFIGADSSATPLHFHLKIKREKLRSDLARSPSLARAELISFLAVPWALCPRRDYSSDPTHQGRVRVCLSILIMSPDDPIRLSYGKSRRLS